MKNTKIGNSVEHLWTIACSASAIDSETNNVSLFNIIEEVGFQLPSTDGKLANFSEKKAIPVVIELVSLWKRVATVGEISSDIKFELLDATNQKMQEVACHLEFKPQHQRMRTRIRMNAINITGQGEYNFSVLLKENGGEEFKEIARIPLVVKIVVPIDFKSL